MTDKSQLPEASAYFTIFSLHFYCFQLPYKCEQSRTCIVIISFIK